MTGPSRHRGAAFALASAMSFGAGAPLAKPLLGEVVCRTPEELKAWSQNLGHENVLATFSSYGAVALARQAEIIQELARPRVTLPTSGGVVDFLEEQLKRYRSR